MNKSGISAKTAAHYVTIKQKIQSHT